MSVRRFRRKWQGCPMKRLLAFTLAFSLSAATLVVGQTVTPAPETQPPAIGDQQPPVATFHVNVVSRTTQAINYRYRSDPTHVNFKGTDLMPKVEGKARVQSHAGKMDIEASLNHLQPPTNFGPEYL